jgi:hypothetical protein
MSREFNGGVPGLRRAPAFAASLSHDNGDPVMNLVSTCAATRRIARAFLPPAAELPKTLF